MVGVGVGNIPHTKIPYILASAFSLPSKNKKKKNDNKKGAVEELNYRLVDTSHTDSALEVLVGRSLSRLPTSTFLSLTGGGDTTIDATYHVMIKIWHTHLGYERTMLSVQDSLSDILPAQTNQDNGNQQPKRGKANKNKASSSTQPDVRIHAILQYPRCYDSLFTTEEYLSSSNFSKKYNSCQEEESALDDTIKSTGTSPLLDKENAWKRTYRALEEMYHHGTLESIGLSNFGPHDLTELFDFATVGPHVYQGTLETLLLEENEELVESLVKHGVHYQCYDVASTLLKGKESGATKAWKVLERIGATHGAGSEDEDAYGYSPIQVVLGWLIHHRGVGIVPGTTNIEHLAENSPSSLGNMSRFSPREVLDIENAVLALIEGSDTQDEYIGTKKDDLSNGTEETIEPSDGVVATFFNTLPSRNIKIFHVHPTTGEQIQLSHSIPPGRSGRLIVNAEDVLIAYDAYGVAVKKFLVEDAGGSADFSVDSQ